MLKKYVQYQALKGRNKINPTHISHHIQHYIVLEKCDFHPGSFSFDDVHDDF
jgi:hypothetical protein